VQVCSFQQCVTPGGECLDRTDCAEGEYCEYSLGEAVDVGGGQGGQCAGGSKQLKGKCLPSPPECPEGQEPPAGGPITCLSKCEFKPPAIDFEPVLKYAWGGVTAPPFSTDVMMAPVVAQLDDDNCDGKITADDIPEILFSTFSGGGYFRPGTLHAISIVNGQVVEKLTIPDQVHGSSNIAVADLDGDGKPEIVACMAPAPGGASCCDAQAQDTGVVAFRADGSVLWKQTDTSKVHCGYDAPAIADPDGTGKPVVMIGYTLLDGATGEVKTELLPHSFGAKYHSFADVDGDGKLDVVGGQHALRVDGTKIWDISSGPGALPTYYPALGDFDKDGKAEVVLVGSLHRLYLGRHDPASPSGFQVIRQGLDINNGISTAAFCNAGSEYGGGPPTVADFDGDGFPDVGIAGAVGYAVFSGKKLMDPAIADKDTLLWFKETRDCSSAVTGSSVFDFNGDGRAEVLYSDEQHLWMYDGVTGTNLIPSTCNTTGTLWEYPLVADVDNDGQADIIVASNAYGVTCPDDGSKQAGIRIFGSKSGTWVRTRRVWNQHTYHVTNINEDNSVPLNEKPNWQQPRLNNFRQNIQPEGEFSAPDLVVSIAPKCSGEFGLVATVRNVGQAAVPAGVLVDVFAGEPFAPSPLGQLVTTKILYPAESESLTLLLPAAPAGVVDGSLAVYAQILPAAPPATWKECRPNNNLSAKGTGVCKL
jgi:hypothetical protein